MRSFVVLLLTTAILFFSSFSAVAKKTEVHVTVLGRGYGWSLPLTDGEATVSYGRKLKKQKEFKLDLFDSGFILRDLSTKDIEIKIKRHKGDSEYCFSEIITIHNGINALYIELRPESETIEVADYGDLSEYFENDYQGPVKDLSIQSRTEQLYSPVAPRTVFNEVSTLYYSQVLIGRDVRMSDHATDALASFKGVTMNVDSFSVTTNHIKWIWKNGYWLIWYQ